ncbi:MAG: type II toxin-antitoxin system HicB family antitoxin [Mogibacterium sp.]|nr:type II toxin-antitoxin system HicB family antitoxin [Mogibacterium sp.]
MKAVYPTFIKNDGDAFLAFVPDLRIYTQGYDFYDAIEMARDAICLALVSKEDEKEIIPEASDSIRAKEAAILDADEDLDFSDGTLTFVDVDTIGYRNKLNKRSVKKNCTIPAWLNEKAEQAGVNFSRVLQDALVEIVGTN